MMDVVVVVTRPVQTALSYFRVLGTMQYPALIFTL